MSKFNKNGKNLTVTQEQEWLDQHSAPAPTETNPVAAPAAPVQMTPFAPLVAEHAVTQPVAAEEVKNEQRKGRRGLSARRKKGNDNG